MRNHLLLGALLVVSCGQSPRSSPRQRAAQGRSPAVLRALTAEVCRARAPCALAEWKPAGEDDDASVLTVARFDLGESVDSGCHRHEYWLAVAVAGRLTSFQHLHDLCNDGYGAAGVGEDEVSVFTNRMEISRSGGSAWRWTNQRTIQLSPLRTVLDTSSGSWTLGPNEEETSWDWADFRGHRSSFVPTCAAGADELDADAPGTRADYALIPSVRVAEDFAAEGWRTVPFGKCAAYIDGSAREGEPESAVGGFLLAGKMSAWDATLGAVVGLDGWLYLTIRDETFHAAVGSGGEADRVEIHTSAKAVGYFDHCVDPAASGPVERWTLGVADGTWIEVPAGKQGLELLRTRPASATARFKIRLPSPTESLSLVYVDTDDGKVVERRISTSRSVAPLAALGRLLALAPERVVCGSAAEDGIYPELTRKVGPRDVYVDDF